MFVNIRTYTLQLQRVKILNCLPSRFGAPCSAMPGSPSQLFCSLSSAVLLLPRPTSRPVSRSSILVIDRLMGHDSLSCHLENSRSWYLGYFRNGKLTNAVSGCKHYQLSKFCPGCCEIFEQPGSCAVAVYNTVYRCDPHPTSSPG